MEFSHCFNSYFHGSAALCASVHFLRIQRAAGAIKTRQLSCFSWILLSLLNKRAHTPEPEVTVVTSAIRLRGGVQVIARDLKGDILIPGMTAPDFLPQREHDGLENAGFHLDRPARFAAVRHTFSMSAMAWAAMPEPSPVKPRRSSVVAFTLTLASSMPRAPARFRRMASR